MIEKRLVLRGYLAIIWDIMAARCISKLLNFRSGRYIGIILELHVACT
jgi:hypothetical protein